MDTEKKKNVQKVIIDTDPGIDDAMAIMIALKEHKKGNVNILAITLVNGNSTTSNAQINILRILEVFNLLDKVHTKYIGFQNTLSIFFPLIFFENQLQILLHHRFQYTLGPVGD